MAVTASQLRADVYNLLDRVLETGVPLEIERSGRILRIVADNPGGWMSRLEREPRREGVTAGNPDDLVHIDWSGDWKPEIG